MATTRVIDLVSGKHRRIPADITNVVGIDSEGRIVVDHFDAFAAKTSDLLGEPFVFGLTLCCNASDKGMEDGVFCRACYGAKRNADEGMYYHRWGGDWTIASQSVDWVVGSKWAPLPETTASPVSTTEKENSMSTEEKPTTRVRKTPAAEQFAALGIDKKDWTDAMNLAVKQRWSGLPVDAKVADLRAQLAAVKVADVPSVDEMVAEHEAVSGKPADDAARAKATAEHKRLKRNAAVNAWRERNQIQAALDARDLKFAALRSKRGKVA